VTLLGELTIVSGGQTGADRAALDFAIEHGIPHGGWCPRGRLAEDGPLDLQYQLSETPSRRYEKRTKWNVRDSDATVVLSIAAELRGGSALTVELAQRLDKPWLHLARDSEADLPEHARRLVDFLAEHSVRRLNVAGPRASQEPCVAAFVHEVLRTAIDL
jgi:hypothetical protein